MAAKEFLKKSPATRKKSQEQTLNRFMKQARVFRRKQPKKVQGQLEEIEKFACPLVHGGKNEYGVWYTNAKDYLKYYWPDEDKEFGRFNGMASLRLRDLIGHFTGVTTRYYTNRWGDVMLMKIDIDIHSGQDRREALAALSVIKALFPGIQYEVSTNGRGFHCYFKLHRQDLVTPEDVRILTNRFKHVMTAYVRDRRIDVDAVELKGNPSVWKGRFGDVDNMIYGQLAKIPRTLSQEQLQNTHDISVGRLNDLLDGLEKSATDDKKRNFQR